MISLYIYGLTLFEEKVLSQFPWDWKSVFGVESCWFLMNSDSMDREGLLSLARRPRATNSEGFKNKIKNKIVEIVRSRKKKLVNYTN